MELDERRAQWFFWHANNRQLVDIYKIEYVMKSLNSFHYFAS